MAKYSKLENNSEVMDVLYAIVLENKSQKEIVRKLKQKRSTVSSKIWFLKKNKIIKKERWSFYPDQNNIYKKMLNALDDVLNNYISIARNLDQDSGGLKKIKKNAAVFFTKETLLGILKVYSLIYFYGFEKLSMVEMIYSFLNQLRKVNDNRIRRIDPKLLSVKKAISEIPMREELVFDRLVE